MSQSSFQNPDKTCRTAPFWSWNGTLEPAELKRQIKMMHEQGMGGFFMHSRVGLETPYMSDAWMSAVAASIETARELDMEAWFYDEDKWPSGFAGGMVPALGDDYRIKGLETFFTDAAGVEQLWVELPAGVTASSLRAIFRLDKDGQRLTGFTRLAAPPKTTDNGDYMLCQTRIAQSGQNRFNGESYVDLMNPKVTEAFLRVTHEKYKEQFGSLFGPNVPGIFTDEPNVWPIDGGIQTAWTTALPTRFMELWGYDLIDRLPLLFLAGDGCEQVRHDYWATVTHLYLDNFTRPVSEWCAQNGLMFTGHYLGEDNPVNQAMRVGSVMAQYQLQHLPGIDHLRRDIRNPITLKQVSSVAHQMGRNRVLCEIFGKSGHSMSFAEQKWMSDFHFALGVNFLNQHLTLYSMLGERKRDFPANISWAQPYWQDYGLYNNYAARCSWFTQRGDFRADILLLHPMSSIWSLLPGRMDAPAYPSYQEQVEEAQALKNNFLTVFDALLAEHRDFDLGDELVMAEHAQVEGGELCVGRMRYKVVVLPYSIYLEVSTLKLLQSFIRSGGQVYLVGSDTLSGKLPGSSFMPDAQALVSTLDERLTRLVSITGADGKQAEKILCHQRIDAKQQLFFLANTDLYEDGIYQVEVAATGDITVFEPTTGEVAVVGRGQRTQYAWAAVEVLAAGAGSITLEWAAPPAGSLMFSVGDGPDPAAGANMANSLVIAREAATISNSATLSGPWQFARLHPNVLTLDYCRASIAGGPMSSVSRPTPAIREEVLAACGLSVQIQPYRYLTGQMPSRSVKVQLEFDFVVEAMPTSLALALEQPGKIQVKVNGQPATKQAVTELGVDIAFDWLSDSGFGALDVLSLTREGLNTITIDFTAAADGGEVEELYLLGDFAVWKRDGVYVIGREPETLVPGSWVEQGYPFYVGTMRYKLVVEGAHRWLDLSDTAASLLRVKVNGGQSTALPWRPWVADVGKSMRPGNNTVEVDVVSTLRNAFGPLHHKKGDITDVRPADFRVDPSFWTDDYHFVAYGLLGPVRLA